MILAQLLHTFPGAKFSVRAVPESWEVCMLHGALHPGMTQWLTDHNLKSERRPGLDGYVIRWLTDGPDRERRTFETVKKFANLGYMSAKQRRLYGDNEMRGFDRQLNDFILAAAELGL